MDTTNFLEVLQSVERQLETLLASDLTKQDAFSLTEARFHTRAARSRFKATGNARQTGVGTTFRIAQDRQTEEPH